MVSGVLAAFTLETLFVLLSTHGHFTYSLDDPYIHLALADEIRAGHYGINPGEASSPSSSILWPFLLSLTAGSPVQDFVPLAWNLVFTVASVLVLDGFLARYLRGWRLPAATTVTVLSLNLIGVAFSGMEHSLQVLLALLLGRGVVDLVAYGRLSRFLLLAMAIGPLVRYENAALSVGAMLVLVAVGRWRAAVLPTLVWVAGLCAFSLFLQSRGLDPLPSSVLAKSPYAGGAPISAVVAGKLQWIFIRPTFLVCWLVLILDAALLRRWTVLHWFAAFVLTSHAIAGDFGWFGRYELYLLAALFPVLVSLAFEWGRAEASAAKRLRAILTAAAVVSALPLALCTFRTATAAADIWVHQAQTARFVRDYWRQPIAVNDLGLVAYRGGEPVLDLFGLGDQEARRLRVGADGQWVGPLVARREVRLAAVYASWFEGQIPDTWVSVGTLTGHPNVFVVEPSITVYATEPGAVTEACDALRQFAADGSPARIATTNACAR